MCAVGTQKPGGCSCRYVAPYAFGVIKSSMNCTGLRFAIYQTLECFGGEGKAAVCARSITIILPSTVRLLQPPLPFPSVVYSYFHFRQNIILFYFVTNLCIGILQFRTYYGLRETGNWAIKEEEGRKRAGKGGKAKPGGNQRLGLVFWALFVLRESGSLGRSK